MTALINTHSGEKIEAMVWDVVRYEIYKGLGSFDVGEIIEVGYQQVSVGGRHGRTGMPSLDCTLLHRPFAVGMLVKFGCITHALFDVTKLTAVLDNGRIVYKRSIVHTNPAWRDHPDYKPEEMK